MTAKKIPDSRNTSGVRPSARPATTPNEAKIAEPTALTSVREAIQAAGLRVDSAELTMVPKTTVEVADEATAKKVLRLIDQLEENDDVQDVYANFDIPERVLETAAT